ncbi:putative T7SS-secreted protein [Saccharopolyspora sp. 5N102]|uniref:putative T7SS-secreted protein n=1 Tax=Saccharopolyspora sp. 5N102 TaxID=3375155 RepID=UPI0037AE1A14
MAPDPREEVPGELPAVDETLATMTKLGTAFENAAQGFQKIDTAGWEGPTADAFRDYYQQEPPKWFRAADAFTESADALRQYREVLAWAQRQAEQACADIERADRQTAQAEAKYEQAADQGNATEPFQDPGAAARNQAQASLDAAKEQVEEAAKKAASALIKASEKAPPQPGPLTMLASGVGDVFQNVAESYGDFWKGSFDGALDMLQQARTLNPFDPYNVMHPQQYGENISQLAASTVAAGKAFISDPIGTGKAMIGAGIDSFTKDPAGFLGRLAPEVAAGLATSGSSTAGSLGRQALSKLDDLVKGKSSADLPGGRSPAPAHHQPPGNVPGPTNGHAPPANTPTPRPESMPLSHQPSPNTGTTFEHGNHSPAPNHGYNPSPPQSTASNWNNPHTGSDFSESTRDAHREQYEPGQSNRPGSAQHSPPGSWQSPSPAENQPFGPKGSDWEHRNTADTPSTSNSEERPRLSWGRGNSRWDDDDADWGDPWENSEFRGDEPGDRPGGTPPIRDSDSLPEEPGPRSNDTPQPSSHDNIDPDKPQSGNDRQESDSDLLKRTIEDDLRTTAVAEIDPDLLPEGVSWRNTDELIYRVDDREDVFESGFEPRSPENLELQDYVDNNTESGFVSWSRDEEIWMQFSDRKYVYVSDAPGGIDVNATIPRHLNQFERQEEIAQVGGTRSERVLGRYAIIKDPETGLPVRSDVFEPNPYYKPLQ